MDCRRRGRFCAPWFDSHHMPMLHRQTIRFAAIDQKHMLNSSDNCSTSGRTAVLCHCCWCGRLCCCSCGCCSDYCCCSYCCCYRCCSHCCSSSCWTLTRAHWDNRPCRQWCCHLASKRAINFYWRSLAACSMAYFLRLKCLGWLSISACVDDQDHERATRQTLREFPLLSLSLSLTVCRLV